MSSWISGEARSRNAGFSFSRIQGSYYHRPGDFTFSGGLDHARVRFYDSARSYSSSQISNGTNCQLPLDSNILEYRCSHAFSQSVSSLCCTNLQLIGHYELLGRIAFLGSVTNMVIIGG